MVVGAVTTTVVVASEGDRQTPRTVDVVGPPGVVGEWVPHVDRDRHYRIDLSPGWRAITQDLTPNVTDPRQIGAFANFDVPAPDGENLCDGGVPQRAMTAMGTTGAFVWLLERSSFTSLDGVAPRPASFADVPRRGPWCAPAANVDDELWTEFTDAGRFFYVFVAIGRDVTADQRADVWRMVDSLRIDAVITGNATVPASTSGALVLGDSGLSLDPAPAGYSVLANGQPITGIFGEEIWSYRFGKSRPWIFSVSVQRHTDIASQLERDGYRPSSIHSTRARSYFEYDSALGPILTRFIVWAESRDVTVSVSSTDLDYEQLVAIADTVSVTS
jgi:hypothetical protein